jgi:hypothetical protein
MTTVRTGSVLSMATGSSSSTAASSTMRVTPSGPVPDERPARRVGRVLADAAPGRRRRRGGRTRGRTITG